MTVQPTEQSVDFSQGPWRAIADVVLGLPPHQAVEVERHRVPHPRHSGFYASTGLNRRCLHHYRRALPDGRGLHVHAFRQCYLVHWDRVDPSVSLVRHFWEDVVGLARRGGTTTPDPVSLNAWPLPDPERAMPAPQG